MNAWRAFASPVYAEKTARLRQAVEEAKGEIASYRAMREETYSKMLAEVGVVASARDARDWERISRATPRD